jgi:hypothetical protein
MWMARSLLVLTVVVCLAARGGAEDRKPIELKIEGFSIRLTDISVVTGEPSADPRGGAPTKIVPLVPGKLYHPEAAVWIQFSYESDFKKGDAPESLMYLALAVELTPGKFWGYQPATLDKASGKGWIRLFAQHPTNTARDIEDTFQLVAYGNTKDGQHKKAVTKEEIRVKYRRDGSVVLSLTQYEELKAGLRRLEELERKVKELEKGK